MESGLEVRVRRGRVVDGVALAAAQLALKLAFRGARASTTAVAATAAKGVT